MATFLIDLLTGKEILVNKTLFTGNTFTQSGITEITQVGDNINIYVPADSITGVTWKDRKSVV